MLAHDEQRYNGNTPHTVYNSDSHNTILPIRSLAIHARRRS